MSQTSLGLSDQEFLEKDPAEFLSEESIEESETTLEDSAQDTSSEDSDETEATSDTDVEEESDAQEQTEVTTEEDKVSQPVEDTQTEPETSTDSDTTESLDTSKKDSTETKEDTPETTEFDYGSAYKKVSSPFKANGTDMQVTDPNDIVRLMQMGANYQKKMSQLKPHLKIVKMLEKNELLDEGKLNNLIDLARKDPKAITKLIQDSNIDPLDIDKDVPSDYQPTNYTLSDKEYNLDAVLDEIKDTETFTKTINVLTKEWDQQSKTVISDNPEIIGIINAHMGNGVFDKVNAVLQQEKTLGKIPGIPDVEAYKQIAEYMYKQGLLTNPTQEGNPATSKVSSNDKKADADRNKKRKAVAPVKQTTTKKASKEEDFLGLSDEEFMKRYAVR